MTIYSMTKIWAEAFWKAPTNPNYAPPEKMNFFGLDYAPLVIPVATLAFMTVIIGLSAEPIFVIAERSAEQLLDPSIYIDAVSPQ